MMLKAPFFLVLLLSMVISIHLQGQHGARFFDSNHNGVFTVKDGNIHDSVGNITLTTEGNIIFHGNSTSKDDILYLLKSKGLFSNKTSYLYDKEIKDVEFSIRNGKMFLGSKMYVERLVVTVAKDGKRYTVFAGSEKQKVGYGLGDLSEIELAAIMLAYSQQPEVKQAVGDIIDRKELIPREGILGIIKPAWENNFYREWSWNGRKLEPRWGNRPEDEWIFDGKTLEPYWGANVSIGFRWDGEVLRPTWGDDPN
jgi:hypothetical protein